MRNGGAALVEALVAQGVDLAYCVPGESYLDVLDALYDTPSIRLVVARHEGAAANMAEADGKLTGRPGICFVTRGPGATHASVGLHTALQDSTPLILFVGLHDQAFKEREGFQEIDVKALYGATAKWAAEIPAAARIPEFVARAFRVATGGRPGPVVLGLPENVLSDVCDTPVRSPVPIRAGIAAPATIAALRDSLASAERPLAIVGGSGWTDRAVASVAAFAKSNDLPVATAFRRQDLFDNHACSYVGHLAFGLDPALGEMVRRSDLLIVLGSRLGEIATGAYSLIEAPYPRQALVHVYPDPEELGRVFQPDLPILLRPAELPSLLDAVRVPGDRWSHWRAAGREAYLAFSGAEVGQEAVEAVNLAEVVKTIGRVLGDDAIVTNGAGNYAVWGHRFHRFRSRGSQLAPTNGAMGYGLPAAIAAKIRRPDRPVVCLAGDGCFQMYPQELGTAFQEDAAIIVLVVNNGMYGTIRMHQEREHPERVIGTTLVNPDFVALAGSYGAHAERVTRTGDFAAALERARDANRPALLELITDPLQITPAARLA